MSDCRSSKSLLAVKSAIALTILFCLMPSAHAETWLCTYADKENKTLISKFKVEGDEVIQTGGGIAAATHFKIALNNERALVATDAFETRDPATHRMIVLGISLLIDKESGAFRLVGGIIQAVEPKPGDEMKPTIGNCVQN